MTIAFSIFGGAVFGSLLTVAAHCVTLTRLRRELWHLRKHNAELSDRCCRLEARASAAHRLGWPQQEEMSP